MNLDDLLEAREVNLEQVRWRKRLERLFIGVARTASDVRRVLEHAEPHDDGLYDALSAARGQLVETLRTEGVVLFGRPGEPADPQRHHVVESRDPGTESSSVLEVESEGVIWDSDVLQKASVIVSKVRKQP